MNNAVRDWRGNIIGYRCWECGEIKQSMWGTTCNSCRNKHEEASKLRDEIAELRKAVEGLKEPQRQ